MLQKGMSKDVLYPHEFPLFFIEIYATVYAPYEIFFSIPLHYSLLLFPMVQLSIVFHFAKGFYKNMY